MSADGVNGSVGICVLVGVMSLFLGLIAISGILDGFVPGLDLRTLGWLSIAEGLIYFVLAYGIRRGSRFCAIAAASLYTLGTLLMLGDAGPGLVIRIVFLTVLWKGAWEIWCFHRTFSSPKNTVRIEAPPQRKTGRAPGSRSKAKNLDGHRRRQSLTPRRLRSSLRDEKWRSRGSTQLPSPHGRTRAPSILRHRQPRSMCPNCRDTFPSSQARCTLCSVMLVEV